MTYNTQQGFIVLFGYLFLLKAADARIAVSCGVSGIVVSNHGARQLDTVPATVSKLKRNLIVLLFHLRTN